MTGGLAQLNGRILDNDSMMGGRSSGFVPSRAIRAMMIGAAARTMPAAAPPIPTHVTTSDASIPNLPAALVEREQASLGSTGDIR
jgi:hypothetical protein